MIGLSDLFYYYDDINSPNFQTLITARKEFNELGATKHDKAPKRGELYPHQELIKRYLLQYDRLFIIARAGTGKTGSVIGFTEANKQAIYDGLSGYINDYILPQRTSIRKVYILVKGPTIMNEIKKAIVCTHSREGDYLTSNVLESTTTQQVNTRINSELAKYYEIMTYTKFYKQVSSAYRTPEAIIEYLSNCMFIIDEVQNLRITDTSNVVFETAKNSTKKIQQKILINQTLHQIFHTAKNIKVAILSATPAVNFPNEIPPAMNLLLPLDKQMDTSGNTNYVTMPLEEIKPYFEGYVSYILEQENFAKPTVIGTPLYDVFRTTYNVNGKIFPSSLVLNFVVLSDFQAAAHRAVKHINEEFRYARRMALLMTYPDGSTGKEGFKRYVTQNPTTKVYSLNDDLKNEILSNPAILAKYSIKFNEVIANIQKTNGCCYIYTDFVEAGSIILGLIMELFGFTKYEPNERTFSHQSGKNVQPYCSREQSVQLNISKALRYAILPSKKPESVLSLFNSPQNWDGGYLKVLIGTPLSREGINLANVIFVELLGTGWTQANNTQAIYRSIRATSNQDRLNELRKIAVKEGRNPDDVKIEVEIRIDCAIEYDAKTGNYLSTADVEVAQLAEEKNIEISMLINKMKRCAIDAQIHFERNRVVGEADYSPACDYNVCNAPPVDPRPQFIDYSSYNVLYTRKRIDNYNQYLKEFFRKQSVTTYKQLFTEAKSTGLFDDLPVNSVNQIIIKAIYHLINDKVKITNQFGQICYVYVDSGAIYIKPGTYEVRSDNTLLDAYYSKTIIGNVTNDVNTTLMNLTRGTQIEIIKQLRALTVEQSDRGDYKVLLEKLNVTNRAKLLEFEFEKYLKNGIVSPVLQYYHNNGKIIDMFEPIEQVQAVYRSMLSRKKVEDIDVMNIQATTPRNDQIEHEKIYLHTIYANDSLDSTQYGKANKSDVINGRIRIYKPSEGLGWRDTTPYERAIYAADIGIFIKNKYNTVSNKNFYAILVAPDEIKVISALHPKGLNAKSIKLIEHAYILSLLNVPALNKSIIVDRNAIINRFGKEISDELKIDPSTLSDQLLSYMYTYANNYKKNKFIETEIIYFRAQNLLEDHVSNK